MKKLYMLPLAILVGAAPVAFGESVGNPAPGSPHDTLNFHLKKAASGMVGCSGNGNAAFVRYDDTTGQVSPTHIYISMTDWEQLDNDGDGYYDEDTPDGVDNDVDGLVDEDGVEPGASTGFIDCDGLDGDIALQIRDTEPEKRCDINTGMVHPHVW
jgi:hypothetical protein